MEGLLDHAFERYFESSGLMGTLDSCLPMIENLQAIGVDELACLIDFGVAVDDVLASLQHLYALRERCNVVPHDTSPLSGQAQGMISTTEEYACQADASV